MRIALLHTAESNIEVFESAASELVNSGVTLHHVVRKDLLANAEQAGGMTPEIAAETRVALLQLANDAHAVLLTCSTLGKAVDGLSELAQKPILRVDGALAKSAIEAGGHVVVLCAVETTIAPTAELFRIVAEGSATTFDVRLVSGAWEKFKAGDREGYLSMVARDARSAYEDGASTVALGQSSMAGAVALVQNGPVPLTSPIAGLRAAIAQASVP